MKTVCIAIPIYKKRFDKLEEQVVMHNLKQLKAIDCFFFAPDSLPCTYYKKFFSDIPIVFMKDKYFCGLKGYNKLLLTPGFYKAFKNYQYLCICQPDAILLKNGKELIRFCKLGWSYIGAPWYPPHTIRCYKPVSEKLREYAEAVLKTYTIEVGNGGLSLRNVRETLSLIRRHWFRRLIWNQNEDYFFSVVGGVIDRKYQVAPASDARKFSLETRARKYMAEGAFCPFGIHAFQKYYPEALKMTKTSRNKRDLQGESS